MWIFADQGYLSIIQDFRDPDTLIVRARFPDHIRNIFPDAQVTKTPGRDYLYRTLLPRGEVAERIKALVEGIEYSNFKDAVEAPLYQRACGEIWGILHRYQS
ncbi:MAG: hypothetical protein QM278_00200 [Pseudomonadota bacterium]|nr:hypothetical protein [Pseudomonadota bacterium]